MRTKAEHDFFSLVFSGGSTPRQVFSYIAANYLNDIHWEKLKIFWGDERCVPPEDNESNYKMARESLLDHVPIPESQIFRIRGEDDPELAAKHYSEIVKQHVRMDGQQPQFDLVMLGMGDDGHTASIFPDRMDLFDSDRFFEVAQNPYSGQLRVTITGKVINQARTIVFLVTGNSKAQPLFQYFNRLQGYKSLPVSNVTTVSGELFFLMDQDAAHMMNND
jgi:6-phosphogluconolactonase